MVFDPMQAALEEAERQASRRESQGNGNSFRMGPRSEVLSKSEAKQARKAGGVQYVDKSGQPTKQPVEEARSPQIQQPGMKRARDGQTFAQQTKWTRDAFIYQYGEQQAEDEWIKQHEKELDENRKTYGVDEPIPGQAPIPGQRPSTGTGAGPAPNRTIGAEAPSATPTGSSAPNTAAPQSGPTLLNPAGFGNIGSVQTPAPTAQRNHLPQEMVYIQSPDGSGELTMSYAAWQEQLRQFPEHFKGYRIVQYQPVGTKDWFWTVNNQKVSQADYRLPSAPGTAVSPAVGSGPGAPDVPSALSGGQAAPAGVAAPSGVAQPQASSAPPSDMPPMPQDGQDYVYADYGRNGWKGWLLRSHPQVASGQLKVLYDPKAPASTEAPQQSMSLRSESGQTIRMGQTSSAPVVQPSREMPNPSRPIGSLLQMTGRPPQEEQRVLQGIGMLLKGDPNGSYAEPYLNSVAQLAWAQQERSQGKNVDPLDAPAEYIESWKDAFFGSDHSVPLVKELDQQMIDYAVDRTPVGQPFRWKEAFGETGENGLISTQIASNDCGTNAFSNVMRSRGYNSDPGAAFQYGKQRGYHDGDQFTGPNNFARMLREEAGISDARALPIDWDVIDAELDRGNVVTLSSGGHYWTVSAKRDGPNGREYFGGATSSVVGNPEWSTASGLRYGGAPNVMVLASGDVDPNSRYVQQMGLPAPQGSGPNRALLSSQTRERAAQRIQQEMMASRPGTRSSGPVQPNNEWGQIAWDLAVEEGVEDPVWIQAIMGQESSNRGADTPDSWKGARGPMQLMEPAAREVGVNRDDPIDNTRGGIRYFKKMLDRYNGNVEYALAAYNAGPGAVDHALATTGRIPVNGETEHYVPAVMERYRQLNANYSR